VDTGRARAQTLRRTNISTNSEPEIERTAPCHRRPRLGQPAFCLVRGAHRNPPIRHCGTEPAVVCRAFQEGPRLLAIRPWLRTTPSESCECDAGTASHEILALILPISIAISPATEACESANAAEIPPEPHPRTRGGHGPTTKQVTQERALDLAGCVSGNPQLVELACELRIEPWS